MSLSVGVTLLFCIDFIPAIFVRVNGNQSCWNEHLNFERCCLGGAGYSNGGDPSCWFGFAFEDCCVDINEPILHTKLPVLTNVTLDAYSIDSSGKNSWKNVIKFLLIIISQILRCWRHIL
jgi:hypothetical protein